MKIRKKRTRERVFMAAFVVAVVALVVGTGVALAEDTPHQDQAVAEQGFGPGMGHGPGGRGEMRNQMIGGEVIAVADNVITLKTISGEEATVRVDENTTYRKEDGDASLADVTAGEKVGIRLTEPRQDGVEMVAEAVMIGAPHRPPRPHAAIGEVTAIDGNNVTVNTADGEKQFTIPEITEGMRLGVAADDDGNVKAVIYDPPERPADAPAEGEGA